MLVRDAHDLRLEYLDLVLHEARARHHVVRLQLEHLLVQRHLFLVFLFFNDNSPHVHHTHMRSEKQKKKLPTGASSQISLLLPLVIFVVAVVVVVVVWFELMICFVCLLLFVCGGCSPLLEFL